MANNNGDGEEDSIELRVDDIAQLFDTLDPYPFPERDLNRDAAPAHRGHGASSGHGAAMRSL